MSVYTCINYFCFSLQFKSYTDYIHNNATYYM